MPDYRVIDIDGHVEPSVACDWTKYVPAPFGDVAQKLAAERFDRLGYMTTGRRGAWDPAARLEDMDSEGIDVAVLFGSSMGISTGVDDVGDLFGSKISLGEQGSDLQLGLALAQGYNNWLHDYCAKDPERLRGAALVPLEDMEKACAEARRAVKDLGFPGIVTRPSLKNVTMDNPYFFPLYETAEALDVPLLVHGSSSFPEVSKRYRTHFRRHAVNFPFSLIMGLMDAVCGGVLERYKTLRLAFLEGGVGWIPWWVDRLDEHFEKLPSHVPNISEEPRALVRRYIHEGRVFFSCEVDEEYLPHAVQELGDEFILYASDYPHWDSVFPGSVAAISGNPKLSEETKRKVLGENAVRLLRCRL